MPDKHQLNKSREARRQEMEEERQRQPAFVTREVVVPERIETPQAPPPQRYNNFQSELLKAYRQPLNHIIRDVKANQVDAVEELITDYLAKYADIANNPEPTPPPGPVRRRRIPGEKVGDYITQFTSYLPPDLLEKWKRVAAAKMTKKEAFNEAVWDYCQKYAYVLRRYGIDAADLPKR